jgi:hypothetical protein
VEFPSQLIHCCHIQLSPANAAELIPSLGRQRQPNQNYFILTLYRTTPQCWAIGVGAILYDAHIHSLLPTRFIAVLRR